MLEMFKYLVGSAGASGYGSKSTAEEVSESCMNSITAIVTGATSGIGEETARVLAKRGVRIIIPARNLKAAEEAKARIVSESDCFDHSRITVMALDLSSVNSVVNFVSNFESLNLPLNLLINNAGRFCYEHAFSEDGIEMTFATNYLGHFLLTKLLLNRMIETAKSTGVQGRIVNVTSNIHSWFSGDIFEYLGQISQKNSRVYDSTRAYAFSKLANVLHTVQLAHKLQEMKANVTVNCVHPGVVKTNLNREREGFVTDLIFYMTSKSRLLKTIPEGAATTCYVATNRNVENVNGNYFADCNDQGSCECKTKSAHLAEGLWSASETIVSTLTGKPQP
ncbi:short-chain dehydrogenase TIC 32, chloroplastic-like isoform X1 [Cucurbita pepo subsp. pepo]|uniref:short-chain dehydrogenase TIC 32, chloroplastic-like isoform X1 n=1 Tax=Cucurbita pepo subsp. pepo TaxID=3664 RepID=UPI000C9D2F1D|nr:short-chain dehydrogenase TIC 32, chloroplastic-like isoform X1 [Cucurbita pepo subsp. pepo]